MSRFLILLLLSVTLNVCWKSVVAKTSCSEDNDEWRCTSGECIPKAYICNGEKQCDDGSDETVELCKDMECSDASFRCSYGACISLKLVCDGVVDCVDKSDEHAKSCLKRRNDFPDDGIDTETRRKNCADWGQMKCWSGQCVSISDKCNGIKDCADGSDEQYSLCKTMLCDKQQFQCGYGACIPKQAKCNGTQECWDGTDEHKELCRNQINASSSTTTKIKSMVVTESIVNPSINAINTNRSTEQRNITKTNTNVYDFRASENVKTTTTQTTTNHVQIENEERKNTSNIEKPLNKRNETISTPKTSTRPPKATTLAENLVMDLNNLTSTNLMKPTAKDNKKKKYSEYDFQITTPKIKVTTKLSTPLTNGTFKIDISSYPPSKQTPNFETNLNSSIDNSFASNSSDQIPPISRPSTEVVPPIVKHPGSLTTISELERDTSKVETTARPPTVGNITPDTTTLPPTTITTKRQQTTMKQHNTTKTTTILPSTTITTKLLQTTTNHHNTTKTRTILPSTTITRKLQQPTSNQYNTTKTSIVSPPTTITTKRQQTVTKPIKECVLRNCDHRLKCKISLPGSRNSESAIDYQGRLSLIEESQVIFNCAEGYDLVGANRLTCTPTGWSHSSPSCIPYCDADFIHNCTSPLKCVFEQPNSRSKIFITKEFTQRVREHSQIRFTCDEGYLHEGPTMRKCTAKGWSNEMPRCVSHCDVSDLGTLSSPLKCKVFDSNIQRLYDYQYSIWNKKFKERSYFEYSCEDGYKLNGENRSTCLNNGWSNDAPTCIPLCDLSLVGPCTAPLLCDHNYKRFYFSFRNWADVVLPTSGGYVDYDCEDGYELDGTTSITCTNDGWSNRVPTCKKTTCDTSILDDCTYPLNCALYDRTVRKYESIYRGDMPQLSNNEYLYINCEDGYNLQGSQYLNCRGGKWNQNMPKCIAPTCSANLLPKCENPLICTAYHDSLGSGQQITNNYSNSRKTYPQGTVVVFDCPDGYTLKGSKEITCDLYGWKYEHETYSSECQKISQTCDHEILDNCVYPMICERFDVEFNDYRKFSPATDQKPLAEAEHIRFSCENGYMLDGRNYLTCAAGKWDHNLPKCIAASSCSGHLIPSCKRPLTCAFFDSKSKSEQMITDNNIIKSTKYPLNTQIIFGCANGYKLKGEEQTTCSSNGWSHEQSLKLPQCTSPCDPVIFESCKEPLNCYFMPAKQERWLPVDSDYLITEVRENSLVYFRCNKDFRREGPSHIECKSKEWDQPVPKCVQ